MESDGDADKCIYTAEVKTSLYILDKKVKRLVHIDSVFFLLFLLDCLPNFVAVIEIAATFGCCNKNIS